MSATSSNHGQHNLVRRLTTKKSELVIIILGTFIASAGLILSFRAYRLSEEANELTRKGNAVAESAYKLQLWEDCHDRQVIGSIKGVFRTSETYFTRTCKILIFVKVIQVWTEGMSLFGSPQVPMQSWIRGSHRLGLRPATLIATVLGVLPPRSATFGFQNALLQVQRICGTGSGLHH